MRYPVAFARDRDRGAGRSTYLPGLEILGDDGNETRFAGGAVLGRCLVGALGGSSEGLPFGVWRKKPGHMTMLRPISGL